MQWRSRDWYDLACKARLGEVKVQRVAGGQRTAVLTSCENYGLTQWTDILHSLQLNGGRGKKTEFI